MTKYCTSEQNIEQINGEFLLIFLTVFRIRMQVVGDDEAERLKKTEYDSKQHEI